MSGFRVQRRACATCIYSKTSVLNIEKLEAQIADPFMAGMFSGWRICHHSDGACCNGFWTRHKDHFQAGQIAQRLGAVELVEEDSLTRGT